MQLKSKRIMQSKLLSILIFSSITTLTLSGQTTASSFKIVGYYPIEHAMKVDTSEVPYDNLTHIILAFVNPDSSGNLNQDFAALTSFTKAAHNHNVKLLYSIGVSSDIPLKSCFVQLQCDLVIGTASIVVQRISWQYINCLLFIITNTHQRHYDE